MSNFWKELKRPIKVLAPMAGYTDSAFRQLAKQFGADVVMTELISADAIFHKSKNWFKDEKGEWQSKKGDDETLQMLKFAEAERPIVIQLFGKYPEKYALAAKWLSENLKPDGIDINMGCPARKVVNSGHGAALIKNPELAIEIVKAVKSNTDLPVSVKTRLGWENDDEILEFAPKLESAGIDALIIHGRTYKDGFKNTARWDNIFKVKEMLPNLTIIGNGDISQIFNFPALPAGRQFSISNQFSNSNYQIQPLDGVAIGRAVFGKPWLFLKTNIDKAELKRVILKHAKLTFETRGEFGMVEFRKHLLAYLKNFPGAKKVRAEAVKIKEIADIERIIASI